MEGGKKMKHGNATLEGYMRFLEDPTRSNLTNNQLNQIICIHGFQKLHGCAKRDLVEALSSIDLQSPIRSTLNQNVSSASLSLEELIQDNCSFLWSDDDDDEEEVKSKSFKRKRQPLQKSNTLVTATESCVSHGSC